MKVEPTGGEKGWCKGEEWRLSQRAVKRGGVNGGCEGWANGWCKGGVNGRWKGDPTGGGRVVQRAVEGGGIIIRAWKEGMKRRIK